MQITINLKQAGKKQPLIALQSIEIEDIGNTPTAQILIEAVVAQQVQAYNSKPAGKNILAFLSSEETSHQASTGKIGFGGIYNENKASLEEARKTAIQAFEDGMFTLFADETEITKKEELIPISENTVFTFIRMSFLAGSYW